VAGASGGGLALHLPDQQVTIDRLGSIDAIRFVSAFAVVLHHTIGRPAVLVSMGWDWAADLFGSLWFGRAAVMVFFLISGFCIHAPYAGSSEFDFLRFLTRRYVRLLLPLAVVVVIATMAGVSYHPYHGWITWTLICEFAYYTCYPMLWAAWRRFGWPITIVASYIVAYAMLAISTTWSADNGVVMMATLVLSGLPVWLLGCWLAEAVHSGRRMPLDRLQVARGIIVLVTIGIGLLQYRDVLGLTWTGPIYGAIAAPWLWLEIIHNRNYWMLTNWGQWSYSLYLVHPVAFIGPRPLFDALPLGFGALKTLIGIALVLACGYLFYRVVELPSHRLAKALAAPRNRANVDRSLNPISG
jgi:peptidoglycan/LPS O-acetylase OafA/YrhL